MFNIFLKSGERQINDLLRAYALCAKIPAGPTEREQEQNWRTVKNQTGGLVEEREKDSADRRAVLFSLSHPVDDTDNKKNF
jgi:hypothetical protein